MIKTAIGGAIPRDDAIAACDSYTGGGIPYVPCGDTRAGVDCLGLVILFYREQFGIQLPNPHSQDFAEIRNSPLAGHFRLEREAVFGSVVTMPGEWSIEHLGIWTPWGILHSRSKSNAVIMTLAKHARITAIYGPARPQ